MTARGAGLLLAALSLTAPLSADELPWRRRAVTASLGVVRPEGLGYGPWLAVGFSQPAGPVSVEPELGYWSRSETAFGLRASISDLHAGMNLVFTPATFGATRLSLGTGAAFHRIETSAEAGGSASAAESDTRAGVMAMAGIERKASKRMAVFAAARCDFVFKDEGHDRDWRFYAGARLGI